MSISRTIKVRQKKEESFDITWDEKGPIISEIEMNQFGATGWDVDDMERRDMAPVVSFIATDIYSDIAGCELQGRAAG